MGRGETVRPFLAFSLVLLLLSIVSSQQESSNLLLSGSTVSAAGPEMDRLAKALAGDWDTVETMVRSQLFPSGDLGRGMVHATGRWRVCANL
jgi:hypothetical protein